MWQQFKGSTEVCVRFLLRALDLNSLKNESPKFQKDFEMGLPIIMSQNTMYLYEFNYYPDGGLHNQKCCDFCFFISLKATNWNLKRTEKIGLETTFKHIQKHFNKCIHKTKCAIVVTDHWDDNAYFKNLALINYLKSEGVLINVYLTRLNKYVKL